MATGNNEKLAVFLHRAKGSVDAAARAVEQALDDAELFVFGELLQLETVKAVSVFGRWRVGSSLEIAGVQLADGEHEKTFKQLELLAYGTFADWKANPSALGDLNEARLRKLKQLSLVSLAESARTLPYAKLLTDLDIANAGDLEELVVSCIYSELILAALDQKRQQVEVQV